MTDYYEKGINDYNNYGIYEEPDGEEAKSDYIKGWTKAFCDEKQIVTVPTHVCNEFIKRNEEYAKK